jgi:hypothetical protein
MVVVSKGRKTERNYAARGDGGARWTGLSYISCPCFSCASRRLCAYASSLPGRSAVR